MNNNLILCKGNFIYFKESSEIDKLMIKQLLLIIIYNQALIFYENMF